MNTHRDRTWMEVSLDVIADNYEQISLEIGSDCNLMAVLKGNAYGLGAVRIAQLLEELGCPMLSVASWEEAMELRDAKVKTPILLLSPVPAHYAEKAVQENIELVVVSAEQAIALDSAARQKDIRVKVHLKVDVGLTRFGIVVSDNMTAAVTEAASIMNLPNLEVVAVMTHYTALDVPLGEEFNLAQIDLFNSFCAFLRAKGLSFKVHSASTMFTSLYPRCFGDYVRTAALVLGLAEPLSRGIVTKPSAALRSTILQIKEVPLGTPVSYGPNYYTVRHTRLAVVPLGFGDGLRRDITNRTSLMVHGKMAPMIGKMTMDYTMIDITDIPEAKEGDIVTLFGSDGELERTAWDFAHIYPATVSEATSVISSRIPRVYIRHGKVEESE